MILLEKIKKARQVEKTIDKVTFTLRRPTDYEAVSLLEYDDKKQQFFLKASSKYMLETFVVDWSEMNEIDLIPGGSPEPTPFSTDVFIAWAEDHLDIWPVLSKAIVDTYLDFKKAQDEALGKREPG